MENGQAGAEPNSGQAKLSHNFVASIIKPFWIVFLTLTWCQWAPFALVQMDPVQSQPGLNVTFKTNGREDSTVLPNVALYIPAGQAPSTFSDPGPFVTTWKGLLAVELRSDFRFSAELNGTVKVDINGSVALDGGSDGNSVAQGNLVRLSKGTNRITVEYHSPASGDAFLRLFWSPKIGFPTPLPRGAFSHIVDSTLAKAAQLRRGQQLFLEHNCQKCHQVAGSIVPEIEVGAPDFSGIGSRRNQQWMARWINNPKLMRATARMPALFHGASAAENAESAAAFLSSLSEDPGGAEKPSVGDIETGKKLFDSLHCAACHNSPDSVTNEPSKISLHLVAEKFSMGALAEFLKKPDAHFAAIRMPNFRLTDEEGGHLNAYLLGSRKITAETKSADERSISRGKEIVQTVGCLNCHSLKLENRFKTKAFGEFAAGSLDRGCLAASPDSQSKAPNFGFSKEEREALAAFAATDQSSLTRNVSWEFVERQTAALNCVECHGKIDGFPPLELLGGKLKPEWATRFIAGNVPYKPRSWLEARMPGFKHYASGLGAGLAALHGYPSMTASEPAIDEEASKIGQKLVSANGGFSCVSCHAIAEMGATLVFESAGINLAYSGERLLKPYYRRWVRNPLAIDPATKMPVYFDEEGKSPLTEIYDGDGAKQIEAIWQYIRKGDKMPPPPN